MLSDHHTGKLHRRVSMLGSPHHCPLPERPVPPSSLLSASPLQNRNLEGKASQPLQRIPPCFPDFQATETFLLNSTKTELEFFKVMVYSKTKGRKT